MIIHPGPQWDPLKERTNMTNKLYHALVLLVSMLAFASCNKDRNEDPTPPSVNEEEVITTVILTFTNATDTATLVYRDVDGDGGTAAVIIGDTLHPSASYTGTLQILNEALLPTDTTTLEIQAESDVHQFFFAVGGGTLDWTGYLDGDGNGLPIGLVTSWQTGGVSNGSITVTLRHQPDKTAAGVSNGDITNAGGETDVEVTLPYVIQ